MTTDDRKKIVVATNEVGNARLTFDDRAVMTVADIARSARRMKRKGLDFIVIDYVQLIRAENPKAQRYEQVGQISGGLKALARELSIPVLALCQLSREAEKEKRPRLSHLRESGSLEQDADVVMLLHRSNLGYNESDSEEEEQEAELLLAKNRNGECGAFKLYWNAAKTCFDSTPPNPYRNDFDSFGGKPVAGGTLWEPS